MKRIIGIDPGKDGAIVVTDRAESDNELCTIVGAYKIPYNGDRTDTKALRSLLLDLSCLTELSRESDVRVFIESRATFGVKAPAYDYNYGRLEALCEIRFDVKYASAQGGHWQREVTFGLNHATVRELNVKKRVQVALLKIFGEEQCAQYLYNSRGNFHDGFSDAAGIAYYGWLVTEHEERCTANVISVNGLTTTKSGAKK